MTLGVCCVVYSVDNVGMIILTHTHSDTSSLTRQRQARLLILYLMCVGASVCGPETFHYLPCWRCQMEIECVRTHLRPEHRAQSIYPPAAGKSLPVLEIGLVACLQFALKAGCYFKNFNETPFDNGTFDLLYLNIIVEN